MKTQILAFGASNSRQSINKQLAQFAAEQIPNIDLDLADLNDFELPIFSVDLEKKAGIPEAAYRFRDKIELANGIVISLAEHNGSFSAAYKNLFDWMSRIDANVWMNKPLLLLATSPGARGGKGVLEHAKKLYSFRRELPVPTFSLPKFNTNFEEGTIKDEQLYTALMTSVKQFIAQLTP
ncbi:MAG: NAD(P)H-dependent oxidoreductase [Bacteroidia bacterium]|nr:NAD(P)H-dependent oxidoreductase [Bacteroidia bacterium]